MTREEKMRFYHSTAWKKMSQAVLKRDHYECQECRKKLDRGETHKINRATQVHHIIHYEDAPERGLDPDNLEAICDGCHNIAHGRVGTQLPGRKKKIITEELW